MGLPETYRLPGARNDAYHLARRRRRRAGRAIPQRDICCCRWSRRNARPRRDAPRAPARMTAPPQALARTLRRHARGEVARHRAGARGAGDAARDRARLPAASRRPAGQAGHRLRPPAAGDFRARLLLARPRLPARRAHAQGQRRLLARKDRAQPRPRRANVAALAAMGWRALTIYECELKDPAALARASWRRACFADGRAVACAAQMRLRRPLMRCNIDAIVQSSAPARPAGRSETRHVDRRR